MSLLVSCGEDAEAPLSPRTAERVTRGLQEALMAGGRAGYRTFLESKEEQADVVSAHGEAFRFKTWSKKTFTSLWGRMDVVRRLFQNASDTRTYAPLDAAWAMEKEHLTMEAREAVGFACAFSTPEEAALLFGKTALFELHPTVIKRALERMEARVAPRREEVMENIREEEEVPEGTRVVVAGMDGVNVLLREKGKNQGRPQERLEAAEMRRRTRRTRTPRSAGCPPPDEKHWPPNTPSFNATRRR